jgi:hypothetical protein
VGRASGAAKSAAPPPTPTPTLTPARAKKAGKGKGRGERGAGIGGGGVCVLCCAHLPQSVAPFRQVWPAARSGDIVGACAGAGATPPTPAPTPTLSGGGVRVDGDAAMAMGVQCGACAPVGFAYYCSEARCTGLHAVFTLDSAVLGLAPLGCGGDGARVSPWILPC